MILFFLQRCARQGVDGGSREEKNACSDWLRFGGTQSCQGKILSSRLKRGALQNKVHFTLACENESNLAIDKTNLLF